MEHFDNLIKEAWSQDFWICFTHVDGFMAGVFDSDSRFLNHIQVCPSHRQCGVPAVQRREIHLKTGAKVLSRH